jgi:hypothetical protein
MIKVLQPNQVCIFFRFGTEEYYNDTYLAMDAGKYARAMNSSDPAKPDKQSGKLATYLRANGAELCNPEEGIPALVTYNRRTGKIESAYSTELERGWMDNEQLAEFCAQPQRHLQTSPVLSVTA